MKQKDIVRATQILLKDGGNTEFTKLMKVAGYTKEETISLPYLIAKEIGNYAKQKSEEAKVKVMNRDNAKSYIESILMSLSQKMLEVMNDKNFEITESFRSDLKTFLPYFESYAKFEGLNKPAEMKIDIRHTINTDDIDPEDAEIIIRAIHKAKEKK